jgi:hypothetical protein
LPPSAWLGCAADGCTDRPLATRRTVAAQRRDADQQRRTIALVLGDACLDRKSWCFGLKVGGHAAYHSIARRVGNDHQPAPMTVDPCQMRSP